MQACEPIAKAMDAATGSNNYESSLTVQQTKVARPQLTPSAKVIAAMAIKGSFYKFTMAQAEQVRQQLITMSMTDEAFDELQQESIESLRRQADIEAADTKTFSEFLEDYLALP